MTTDIRTPLVAGPLLAGAAAPDVEVTGEEGERIAISSLWQPRPLVLVFLGDLVSPFTGDNAAQLRDAAKGFEQVGTGLAVVGAATFQALAAFDDRYSLPYLLLADEERRAFDAYGLEGGGAFVIDASGLVRFGHTAANAADYPPTSRLLAACAEVTGTEYIAPAAVQHAVYAPAFAGAAVAPAYGGFGFTCAKCGGASSDRADISTAGGWLSRFFNFQHRRFVAVSCQGCGYTELYRRNGSAASNIVDLLGSG